MSDTPPRMTPPMEGPSSSFKQEKQKLTLTTILMILGGGGCLVVLIFGGLIGPVFLKYRGQMLTMRRETSCLNNLQRIGSAMSMYATENDGKLPLASKWMDEIQGHLRSPRILQCPVVRLKNVDSSGYAFNDALSGKKLSGANAFVWMVTDSAHLERNAHSSAPDLPMPPRHTGLKRGVSNQLMADGSVKQLFSKP